MEYQIIKGGKVLRSYKRFVWLDKRLMKMAQVAKNGDSVLVQENTFGLASAVVFCNTEYAYGWNTGVISPIQTCEDFYGPLRSAHTHYRQPEFCPI